MDARKMLELYEHLKNEGLSPEAEAYILKEISFVLNGDRHIKISGDDIAGMIYKTGDAQIFQSLDVRPTPLTALQTLDKLLKRDEQREEDGFPKKIKFDRLMKPGKNKNRVVVVPTTVEEKFFHYPGFVWDPPASLSSESNFTYADDEQEGIGSGDGDIGDIVYEKNPQGGGQGGAPGQDPGQDSSDHDMGADAIEVGRKLSEKYELPNLKQKSAKGGLKRPVYEMTDTSRGRGQLLDKKRTIARILKTNLHLPGIDPKNIDPSKLLVDNRDKVYRTLSVEYEPVPQALVIFLRDYSGSMYGQRTEVVVSQHLLIYSWLLYQYQGNVKTRFVLHDTEAVEVPDFYTYYNMQVAGGTIIASGLKKCNEIIRNNQYYNDYNIYLFQGTDGDDWDSKGEHAIPEYKELMGYCNRLGITIVNQAVLTDDSQKSTQLGKYLGSSGILENKEKIRVSALKEDAGEDEVIEGIKEMILE